MGIRFVIGRAGTGKTHHCVTEIARTCRENPLGPRIIWLLPRQATFSAERLLCCGSGLDAIARAQVVSFDQLAREVLSERGGIAIPQISAVGRRMILGHLLRTHEQELTRYRTVARRPGLAAALDSTFSEMERSGILPADVLDGLAKRGTSDASLQSNLEDLRTIYDAYRAFLGDGRLDSHERAKQVIAKIKESETLADADIYVDGFYEFTANERQTLVALAGRCRRVTITLCVDPTARVLTDPDLLPDDHAIFRRTEYGYRSLVIDLRRENIRLEPPILLETQHRFVDESLRAVESAFAGKHISDASKASSVTLLECADRRAEVSAAARYILNLLSQGYRKRQIVVLARNLRDYQESIDIIFRESGISYFVDQRRSAVHHPLVQFTRSLPDAILRNWTHDSVFALLRSGLLPLGADPFSAADELENYAIEHRLHGRRWIDPAPWTFARNVTRGNEDDDDTRARIDAAKMNELRLAAFAPLRPFADAVSKPTLLRNIVSLIRQTFERCAVKQIVERWIASAQSEGRLEEAAEHEQVWSQLLALLSEMSELLGEHEVTLEHFAQILESGLEQFDLAITPPTLDQVIVGDLDRTRTLDARAAVVLGLADGTFPARPSEDSVFADADRKTLREMRMDLEPDTRQRLAQERFLAYIAFSRASESLFVTRPVADNGGKVLGASCFWHELRAAAPNAATCTIPSEHGGGVQHISAPRQLALGVTRWARSEGADEAEFARLYERLRNHKSKDAIGRAWSLAQQAMLYRGKATLADATAGALFPSPLRSSVSRIECFAKCSFQHFARYGLGLEQRSDPEVNGLDLGNIYHGVLENLVGDIARQHKDWSALPKEDLARRIHAAADGIGKTLRNELMLSSAKNRFLLSRIEQTMQQVIVTQQAVAARGQFKPASVEVAFGTGKESLPALKLKTPGGRELLLRGRIDRVDVLESEAAVAVIDYKLRGNSLNLTNVYHGLSLQLLTYLLVLESSGKSLVGSKPTPAAAFYVQLLGELDAVDHPSRAMAPNDPNFDLVKPRGVFDAKFLPNLDSNLTTGKSDAYNVSINKGGEIGRIDSSDAASTEQLRNLLRLVERRVTELADQIMDGEVKVAPYLIGNISPCGQCDFSAVCRFDRTVHNFRKLQPFKRSAILGEGGK